MPRVRFLAPLTLVAALMMAAPHAVRADPMSWRQLCQGVGEFAGLLTDYRNQGKTMRQAVAAAFPGLRVTPDRVVAAEVARQVYATPGLNRTQEIAAIFTRCLAPPEGGTPPEQTTRITGLEAIPLQPGPNHIERFAPDGREATIMLTWRDKGGGRGQDVFLVTMPSKDSTGWQGVGMPQSSAAPEASGVISDEPHWGDDMLRSIRFARGKVDGENATLLLIASRVEGEESAASDTTYEVYHLVQKDGWDGFERIVRHVLPDRYCNADMALTIASSLPLRSSYRGPRTVDGVFTRNGCNDAKAFGGRLPSSTATGLAAPIPGSIEQPGDMQEQLFQQFSASKTGRAQR